jgi:hypothetical protein
MARMPDAASKTVIFGNNASCVKVSRDRNRLLVRNNNGVLFYDLNAIARTGSIGGNLLSEIPSGQCSSVYFVGGNTDRIMTACGTSVAVWAWNSEGNTWSSDEVYRGNSPINDAEPSNDGKQIIILESVGGGDIHGILYSITAREPWFDLGTDYKFLEAAFSDDSNVAVSEHNVWKRAFVMAPLSALVSLGEQVLSQECRPPAPKDYTRSPCWPSSYR